MDDSSSHTFSCPPWLPIIVTPPWNVFFGYLRVMFTVDDLDETLSRLRKHGVELCVSSDVVRYEDFYRLCYIRALGGLLVGLAEELG